VSKGEKAMLVFLLVTIPAKPVDNLLDYIYLAMSILFALAFINMPFKGST
jgi:hypothetical protein